METALQQAQREIAEQRFMSAMCKRTSSFRVEQVLGTGQNGIVARVQCIEPGHSWPDNRYAMKVCFNFDLSTLEAQGAFVNEYRELVRLPSHHNIIRFLCEFFHEIDDSIRDHLPSHARQESIIVNRDGSSRNRKTQFFVIEQVSMSLERFLDERYAPPSIVPHRLVGLIMSQVASGLAHLERHLVAHRDIKLDNILVELADEADGGGVGGNREGARQDAMTIKRCVIADFGTACDLDPSLKSTMLVGNGGNLLSAPWGNQAHIAPELHTALKSTIIAQRTSREARAVELDYSRQAVFELGVIGFEIVTRDGPIAEYPSSVTNGATGEVRFSDDEIARIGVERLGEDESSMLRRMVSCDPRRRPRLEEVIECFDRDREFTSSS